MKLLRNFSIYKTSHFFLLTFFMCRWYACLRIWPTQFYTVGVRWIGPHSVRKYSRISLIRTAEGQFWESILWMCLYYRGRDYMHSGFSGTKWTVRDIQVSVLWRCTYTKEWFDRYYLSRVSSDRQEKVWLSDSTRWWKESWNCPWMNQFSGGIVHQCLSTLPTVIQGFTPLWRTGCRKFSTVLLLYSGNMSQLSWILVMMRQRDLRSRPF